MNCPLCGEPTYSSGHAHEDCPGRGESCQDCGWGCDLDFVDDGECARLDEDEISDDTEQIAARLAEVTA